MYSLDTEDLIIYILSIQFLMKGCFDWCRIDFIGIFYGKKALEYWKINTYTYLTLRLNKKGK